MKVIFDNSAKWIPSQHNEQQYYQNTSMTKLNHTLHINNLSFAYEYVGNNYSKPHITLCLDYSEAIDLKVLEDDINYLTSHGYYVIIATGQTGLDNPIEKMCAKLGIRTKLLYYRGKVCSKFKNSTINTKYGIEESAQLRRLY